MCLSSDEIKKVWELTACRPTWGPFAIVFVSLISLTNASLTSGPRPNNGKMKNNPIDRD